MYVKDPGQTYVLGTANASLKVNDATILIRDIAGDAATKAATKVNPSDDQLAQIDQPANDNVWHEAPDMSAGNIKQQVKSSINKQTPVTRDNLKEAAGDASAAAHPDGSRDPTEAAALAQQDQRDGTSSGLDAQSGLQNGASTLRQRASENLPEDTKQKGRETKERTRKYLSSKMPEERRDQTIWRLKKMIVEIQGHPDCKSLTFRFFGHNLPISQINKLLQPFSTWLRNMPVTQTR